MKRAWNVIGIVVTLPLLLTGCGAAANVHGASTAIGSLNHNLSSQDATLAQSGQVTNETATGSKNGQPDNGTATVTGVPDVSKLTNDQWLKLIEKTNFMGPSDGPYPVIHKGDPVWIDADISKQRIYIKEGDKTIYTMLTSSGMDTIPDDTTPLGTYYVQAEKGLSFYTPNYKEGAKYWTSWKDHGVFLFHSVATDEQGNIIVSEAEKLGHKASHGCFRLPVLDAKWIYDTIPENTKVVIHD